MVASFVGEAVTSAALGKATLMGSRPPAVLTWKTPLVFAKIAVSLRRKSGAAVRPTGVGVFERFWLRSVW